MMEYVVIDSDQLSLAHALGARMNGHPENVPEVLPQLLRMLEGTSDPKVLAAIVESIGQAWTEAATPALVALVDNPENQVRFAVACALPCGVESAHASAMAVAALIQLMDDEVSAVRNWATFGLGAQLSADSEMIRAALAARLDDSDYETRCEALIGLAVRGDERAIPATLAALREEAVGKLVVEAAAELGDPTFLPELVRIKDWWDVDSALLERAIVACTVG